MTETAVSYDLHKERVYIVKKTCIFLKTLKCYICKITVYINPKCDNLKSVVMDIYSLPSKWNIPC